jgi:hypothetical protein
MPEANDIHDYVEASWASSNRARFILIVVITASVLVFTAFWNSHQRSWLNKRLHLARVAAIGCPSKWSDQVKNALPKEDQDVYWQSRDFADVRHISNCEHLADLAKQLEEIQSREVNLIRVPFFGVVLDVNDLGSLGGFAFVIILLWFRFSIARELSNLKLTFDVARAQSPDILLRCYELLAMRQVLTVPIVRGQPVRQFWGGLPLVLYVLPFGVQAAVFVNDLFTWDWGFSVSHANTVALLVIGGICLVLIAILTYLCFELSRDIGKLWAEIGKELKFT